HDVICMFFEGGMCFSGCEGRFMGASFRESRLKKGDRQTINKPQKKIKYILTTSCHVYLVPGLRDIYI
ncbi:MAG: hypothetical protein ACTSRV_15100, partial [Candidatus Freyarchaeota archaeon]